MESKNFRENVEFNEKWKTFGRGSISDLHPWIKKQQTYLDWLRRIVACSCSALRALSSRLNSMLAILRCNSSKAFPLLVTSSGPSMYICESEKKFIIFKCQKRNRYRFKVHKSIIWKKTTDFSTFIFLILKDIKYIKAISRNWLFLKISHM